MLYEGLKDLSTALSSSKYPAWTWNISLTPSSQPTSLQERVYPYLLKPSFITNFLMQTSRGFIGIVLYAIEDQVLSSGFSPFPPTSLWCPFVGSQGLSLYDGKLSTHFLVCCNQFPLSHMVNNFFQFFLDGLQRRTFPWHFTDKKCFTLEKYWKCSNSLYLQF